MPILSSDYDPNAPDPNTTETQSQPQAEPLTKETLWQLYAVDAINQLYPGLRNGVDYAWGRPPDDPTAEPKVLGQAPHLAPLDEGKIREAAQKMADADPYSFYEPSKPLHSGLVKETDTAAGEPY